MGRIGLVKVAVNFTKNRVNNAVHTSWEEKNSCVGVVLLLIFFFGVVCLLFVVCALDFWCDVGCVLVLWVY